GMTFAACGFALLSTITPDTSRTVSGVYMAILGLGIGFTMPVMILSVQNTADSSDLGVATSTITFFRSVGGSIGVAAFGALFSARLANAVPHVLPPALASRMSDKSVSLETVRSLPAVLQQPYARAFAHAMDGV